LILEDEDGTLDRNVGT